MTILGFIPKIFFAQARTEIDSLNNVLEHAQNDSAKVLALCGLSYYQHWKDKVTTGPGVEVSNLLVKT